MKSLGMELLASGVTVAGGITRYEITRYRVARYKVAKNVIKVGLELVIYYVT